MEFFLTFFLIFSFAVYSSPAGIRDWADVVVTRPSVPTTLLCTDTEVKGSVTINWMVQSPGADNWKLVLSANDRTGFSGGSSKASMRLADPNFRDTGVFSLFLLPETEDSGLYSCRIKRQMRGLEERIILLAILTVTVVPAAPIPQGSILRLMAKVDPDFAVAKISWAGPGGDSMRSEKMPNTGTVAKLPQVQHNEQGAYICMVRPWGNSSSSLFPFSVDVSVDAESVASFTAIPHGPVISTATQALSSFYINCPGLQGDFVRLHWLPPDAKKQKNMTRLYYFDRWRGLKLPSVKGKRLQLAGPPYNAEAGSFSFVLKPGLRDGGLYVCDVYLNDSVFTLGTLLTVLKVKASITSSKMELTCLYSETSHIQSANWRFQNNSRQLRLSSNGPGSISTMLPVPITSDVVGNYTCTLQLKNGQTISATQAVTLPYEERVGVATPISLPSLAALLLLLPLVAAIVCVLLWRQKHISDRGIEQSLSVRPTEAENTYENPHSIRQAPPEGSVYMDLKPRGEDDVYKELEL